jgi:exosortase/archaeosortase family protein
VGGFFIAPACSGLEGVAMMIFALSVVLALDWHRFRSCRLWVVYGLGILSMMVANILRIVVIIAVAVKTDNAQTVVDTFQSHFGWALYSATIGGFVWGMYGVGERQRTRRITDNVPGVE